MAGVQGGGDSDRGNSTPRPQPGCGPPRRGLCPGSEPRPPSPPHPALCSLTHPALRHFPSGTWPLLAPHSLIWEKHPCPALLLGELRTPNSSLGPLRAVLLLSSAPNTGEPQRNEVSFYASLQDPLPPFWFNEVQLNSFLFYSSSLPRFRASTLLSLSSQFCLRPSAQCTQQGLHAA